MYIIEEGKAYLVDGEVGYLTNFDTTGKMLIDKDTTIDVLGKVVYTYDEMYAKLNIKYKIEQKLKETALNSNDNKEIVKLKATIEELTKENKELKSLLEKMKTSEEAKNEEPKVEEENTSKEYKKNKK